ncbi:MAG: primosomal protein N' [Clostridia bacterium]|nr:primosomal protein N' [Clostridia bacterium]
MLVASVAISEATRSYDKLYSYRLKAEDVFKAQPGVRVLVPFGRGNKLKSAWIIKIEEVEHAHKLKEIAELVDEQPLLLSEMIKLAEWMKTRYFCTFGDAIRCMVPAGINLKRQKYAELQVSELPTEINTSERSLLERMLASDELFPVKEQNGEEERLVFDTLVQKGYIRLLDSFEQKINEKTVKAVIPIIEKEEFDALIEEGKIKTIQTIRVMEVLFSEGVCSLQDILLIAGVSHGVIRTMVKKGWLAYTELEVERNPFEYLEIVKDNPPSLTMEQHRVVEQGKKYLNENKLNEMLVNGITGSGKTEIYLRLIEEVIQRGKTAIVLVPEIALTPQMTSRFLNRFGDKVAIQHSRLSQGERFDQWRKIKNKEVNVVIGARSAVFSPLTDIGIIIVDEEHELTYKSENTPKYDARQVARARCNLHGALLLLGSATPTVETYYRALNGKIDLQVLKSRPNEMPLPAVTVVDLREELKEGNRSVFSRRLEQELVKAKKGGEQSILFLNRRGYASFLLCRECGYVLKCPHCSVSLTVHAHHRQATCHYCGYTERTPQQCPRCQNVNINAFVTGTQLGAEELQHHPEGFRVIRMDLDTTSGKQGHQKLLEAFRRHEADVLIGTQMVAKGHDFPNVTLVGILAADASLFNSDYRASERTFQLVTQAAGRAGRGQKPGRVILQAYNIDDYALQTAVKQDYEAFYEKEISMRKELLAPPFYHIAVVIVSGEEAHQAQNSLVNLQQSLNEQIEREQGFLCSGILPAPIFMIRNRARWRLIIKHPSINRLVQLMNEALDRFPKLKCRETDITVDIDPPSMI